APWRHAALAQGVGMLLAVAALRWVGLAPGMALLLQAGAAVAVSMLLRQPRWWWLLHAAFLPGVVSAQQLQWPAWIWLLALLLSWAVFGAVHRSRVPLYLSNRAALAALDTQLPAQGRVLDVGAGTGTVLAHLAPRSGLQVTGIEHAWLPWLWARLRLPRRVRLLRGDWSRLDFGDYDLVYAFLSPAAMPALWEKARREMRADSRLVSNRFAFAATIDVQALQYGDGDQRLYVWHAPHRATGECTEEGDRPLS
ncbi:MAG TPA: class I SAM-dependent methyltransferase, partial [Arenimonas sp.]|nr:class I SAM-dependent methyltransferase [Arenimonas sp.]